MAETIWLLIFLSLLGSIGFSLFSNFQILIKRETDELIKKKYGYIAWFCVSSGALCDLASFNFGPLAVKAPLGVATIIIDPFVKHLFFQNDPLEIAEGIPFTVLGTVLSVLSYQSQSTPVDSQTLVDNWQFLQTQLYVPFVLLIWLSGYLVKNQSLRFFCLGVGSSVMNLLISLAYALFNLRQLGALAGTITSIFVILGFLFIVLSKEFETKKKYSMAIYVTTTILATLLHGIVINGDLFQADNLHILTFSFGIIVATFSLFV
jgi:hypothetical protein